MRLYHKEISILFAAMGRIYRDEAYIKKVGDKFQNVFNTKNIKHLEFRHDTGLDISRLCSGELNMTISTVKRIADYLGVTPKDLL